MRGATLPGPEVHLDETIGIGQHRCRGGREPAGADFYTGVEAYHRGDYEQAMQKWLPLAEQGELPAQANVGALYWRGLGTDQNYERAAPLIY